MPTSPERYWESVYRTKSPTGELVPTRSEAPEGIHAEFGASFELLNSVREDHRTPSGLTQAFVYCLCRVGG